MNRNLTLAMLFVALVTVQAASAQEKMTKTFSLGLGLEGALPTGGLKTAYNEGVGATVRAAIGVADRIAITGTSGLIAFIPKDVSGVNLKAELNIPVKAGVMYMLSKKAYGLGEAGTTIAKVYYPSSSGTLISTSSNSFTYSIGAGTHLGPFDTSLRYEGYTGSGFIGLRIGFNF